MSNDQDGAATADGPTPPRGWEVPHDRDQAPDDDALAALVEQLLALVPGELRARLTQALRQLLEAIRALVDWGVQRLERRCCEPVEVRDIPVL